MSLIEDIGTELGKDTLPVVHVGDTVQVHYLIKEGDKERIQIFSGTVLAIKGRGIARSLLVRRIVQGEGVERTFPLHGPRVKDVRITRRGKVRQSRLFYLRDRVGKQTRVGELVGQKARRDERNGDLAGPSPSAPEDSTAGLPEEAQSVEV